MSQGNPFKSKVEEASDVLKGVDHRSDEERLMDGLKADHEKPSHEPWYVSLVGDPSKSPKYRGPFLIREKADEWINNHSFAKDFGASVIQGPLPPNAIVYPPDDGDKSVRGSRRDQPIDDCY